jgi:hypothetical protein
VPAEARPAALTNKAIDMATEPTARPAHFILFEYMAILPLRSFKMISNNGQYRLGICEDYVKEQWNRSLFL